VNRNIEQLTKEQAIELFESNFWETMNYEGRAKFQMAQERLCMPFAVFHEAVIKHLGRPVYTHEFCSTNHESLMKQVFEGAPAPTLEDIINLIPEAKRIIIWK
jgi:hypothetical protein